MSETASNPTVTATPARPASTAATAPETEPLDLEAITFDPRWALQVPPALMVRHRFLPLLQIEDELHVAVEKRLDSSSSVLLERLSGCAIREVPATGGSIRAVQSRLFGDLREALSMTRAAVNTQARNRGAAAEPSPDEAVKICDQILKGAIVRQASDIHFNVTREGEVQVRLRIDGVLVEDLLLPTALRLPIFNRIKVLGGLDISEKRAAQDGSFRFEPGKGQRPIEIRVATISARHGERLTLRLLAREEKLLTLEGLGFAEEHQRLLAEAITLSHGMILLTGPTGSGKSTTLYAALKYLLARKNVNVMTVEDPVEYEIDGVTQTEVDPRKEKVSFASSLRSILRHDPDVVMLGEIRDAETAELAIRAALTGHLVLSTLHTNTALGAVTRLLDLGVDSFLISSVLRLVAAQRLVRRLCPHCARPDAISASEARRMRRPELEGTPCRRATGCLHCAGRGYMGRTGLFEAVPLGAEIADTLAEAPGNRGLEGHLKEWSRSQKYPSLLDNGISRVRAGETTVEEVLASTLDYI